MESFREPVCFVDSDPHTLVTLLVDYLHRIQLKALELCKEYWSETLEQLEELRKKWHIEPEATGTGTTSDTDSPREDGNTQEDEEEEEEEEEEDSLEDCPAPTDIYEEIIRDQEGDGTGGKTDRSLVSMHRAVEALYKKFHSYISTLCVLGFNSGNYDHNLIKSELFKVLNIQDPNMKSFVVKKNNKYLAVTTDRLKFLDISNYLSVGVSYSAFLAAYRVEEKKGHFCYEYLNHPDKLKETTLPSHASFYSTLKGKNITEEEYREVQETWESENMTCLQDLLVSYNKQDVRGFVVAVERMQSYYFAKGIDIFKDTLSVPGVARILLYRGALQEGAYFPRFGEQDEDLYLTYKAGLTGGPSIIFKRYSKSGETKVRNGDKVVKQLIGFDANALYLWAIAQAQCTGFMIRRMADNGFKPEKSDNYTIMYIWMEYVRKTTDQNILHRLNNEREFRCGPYLTDGYCPETNTVFEVGVSFFLFKKSFHEISRFFLYIFKNFEIFDRKN